jgi:hypothetical protein
MAIVITVIVAGHGHCADEHVWDGDVHHGDDSEGGGEEHIIFGLRYLAVYLFR